MAGSSDFRLCTQQKHKPHLSPHYRGVGQEYWQSLSYLPTNLFPNRFLVDKVKKKNRDIVICRIIKNFFTITAAGVT